MARGTIEYNKQMVVGIGFRELIEERLQAPTVHPRKIQAEALSRCRLNHCIEVGPLVGAFDNVGRTKALRRVSPPVPVDEAKTGFIES
jgi:hypothetical protein